ncbi:MAG: nucleotide exchange factor GrpE [Alkaliphilus sp.]
MEIINEENVNKPEEEKLEGVEKKLAEEKQTSGNEQVAGADDIKENEEKENEDELSMFNKRIKEKEAELAENRAKFQRLQADFTNYKKRVEKEKSEIFLYASEKLVCELLESIDDLERAAEQKHENSEDGVLKKGIELTLKKIKEAFVKHNIEEIEAMEKPFDLNLHHAVTQEETEAESETVIEVFQKGYTINGKVIRPAMVKVSK